jgi:hypothetical protein
MERKGCCIQWGIFLAIVMATALAGTVIAVGIAYRWPRIPDINWEANG